MNGLIAVLLVAEVLSAQPASVSAQETGRALQLLHSPQWVEKAWGAYLAGRLHSDDLNQRLIEEFRFAAPLRDTEFWKDEHAYVTVLFDAAIEAGITVPAELLEPFQEHWLDPVIILLARDKESEDLLLKLSAEKSHDFMREIAWLAANNLLSGRRSGRWYAAMVGEITATHRFTVVDQGFGPGNGGGIGGGSGCGVTMLPKGFPPAAHYVLENMPYSGSVLLAKGPPLPIVRQDIYYTRTVVPTNQQAGSSRHVLSFDRTAIRIGYLAELGGKPFDQTEQLLHGETLIHYVTVEGFESEAASMMEVQAHGIRELIQHIKDGGLSAPGLHLQIIPEVIDQRHGATNVLPAPPPRPVELH